MTRSLPVVLIEGIPYFDDERLAEYRRVDNPHVRLTYLDAWMRGIASDRGPLGMGHRPTD